MSGRLALALAACLLAGSQGAGAASLPTEAVRRFCGELVSGGKLGPVETRLRWRSGNGIDGTYSFSEGSETVDGRIVEVGSAKGPRHEFRWTDRFGSGSLVVTFGPDLKSFDGLWNAGDAKPAIPWTGKACSAPTS